MPIKRYKILQTGPKTQFGGEKLGLLKSRYQVFIALIVNGVLATPINSQPRIEIINLG